MTRGEIDSLGSRLRDGARDDVVLRKLSELFVAYENAAIAASDLIVSEINLSFEQPPTFAQRPTKTLFSIAAKLNRDKRSKLSTMQDIIGCRIIVQNRSEQYTLLSSLALSEAPIESATAFLGEKADPIAFLGERPFKKTKIVDRNEKPSHGYRAIHLVVSDFGAPYEVQIRTPMQNRWAQLSERLNDISPGLKYGEGESWLQDRLLELSEETAKIEREERTVTDLSEDHPDIHPAMIRRQEDRIQGNFKQLQRLYDEFDREIRR